MKVTVLHSLPGRLRIQYDRRLSPRRATVVQTLLLVQDGMEDVSLNSIRGTMLLRYDKQQLSEPLIMGMFRAIGSNYLNDQALLDAVGDIPLQQSLLTQLIGMVVRHKIKSLIFPIGILRWLTVLSVAPRVLEGLKELRRKRLFNSKTLDATALTTAMMTGDHRTAGSVNLLLNIGDTIEEATRRVSYENLSRTLISANEKVHLVVGPDEEREVPLASVRVGDQLHLRSGEEIPVDAIILSGEGMVNQAGITGESVAIYRHTGDTLFAGTVLEEGDFCVKVREIGQGTKIHQIMTLIDQSAARKANVQEKAEKLADKLVPYNFLLAALTYLWTRNPQKAASTLMVDYSCAMKLSAPISVLAAMRQCALMGILTKGGKCLEALSTADTLFVDKTGTLTAATPRLQSVVALDRYDQDEVLRLAACLEEHFPHPLARAVTAAAEERNLHHRERHAKVENIVAHGISSSIDGERVMIGSAHFIFEDMGIPEPKKIRDYYEQLSDEGCTVLCLAKGKKAIGLLGIHDPIREEVPEILAQLRKHGFKRIVMLTGDNISAAQKVARQLHLDGVHAQLLPEDKLRLVQEAKARGERVVMLGDGINDAPALSEATVGIAMGGSPGITGQTADIVLSKNRFDQVLFLRKVACGLIKRIKFNNAAIVGVNSALIAGQLTGRLTNASAAFLHNGSTVGFALNAMRPMVKQ